MPLQTVSDENLRRGGFSAPASASSYYPANDQNTHIHLGVATSAGGQRSPAGTHLVSFISLKVGGNTAGRLVPDSSGTFHLDSLRTGWQPGWKDHLRNYLGPMIQT